MCASQHFKWYLSPAGGHRLAVAVWQVHACMAWQVWLSCHDSHVVLLSSQTHDQWLTLPMPHSHWGSVSMCWSGVRRYADRLINTCSLNPSHCSRAAHQATPTWLWKLISH